MKKTITSVLVVLAVLLALTPQNGQAQQLGDKVYWMVTTEVSLGKLAEYHAFNEKELAPLMEKHGYKQIATWQTIVGDIEEVITVAEFENMAAYHKARRSLLGSEEWKTVSKKLDALVKGTRSRFLSATPYSKMK
jgi:antibiotic biosynthesis monooxygenase (ABM) superfamily enzyme